MCFFRHNNGYISLPDQKILFSLPYALFGQIEKRSLTALGWRWRKRVVVLNPNGHLIIYKYFLEGIGAGKPFLGRIIHLHSAEHIQTRMNKDVCYIKIYDHNRKRTELRIKGAKARLWAAKVFIYEAPLDDCKQCSTIPEIRWSIELPRKPLDPKISTLNIHNVSAARANHTEEFSKVIVTSVSSESLPDYTISDASYQNNQLSTQILDVERIKISEMITANGANSKHNNVESITMQSGNAIFEKYADQKIETNDLVKRSKSSSEFIKDVEFSIAKEANRSISLDQLNVVLVPRQNRFRKYMQNMIESRFYESLTESSLNYSVSKIQKLHAQAGNLRTSQTYPILQNNASIQSLNGRSVRHIRQD
ncbi:Uncharacterized protein ACO02O_01207 [Dirofilaria immitis]